MPTDLRPRKQPEALELDLGPSAHPRHGIIRLTVEIPSSHARQSQPAEHPPPRWKTPEFMFYALVIAVVVPIMAWIPITLSSGALDVVIILDFNVNLLAQTHIQIIGYTSENCPVAGCLDDEW